MKRLSVLYLFLIPMVIPTICRAEGLSLGVGYPYISMKYDFKALAAEGRFVTGSGVQAYTGRGYWNFHKSDSLKGFTGLEGGYIKFDTLDTKGTGNEVALFIGGEYFATKNISLLVDFAPTLISLKHDTYSDLTASSFEYVVNFGFYLHFGKSQPKVETPQVPTVGSEINKPVVKSVEIPEVAASTTSLVVGLPQIVPISTGTAAQEPTTQTLVPSLEPPAIELHLATQPVSGIPIDSKISISSTSAGDSLSGSKY